MRFFIDANHAAWARAQADPADGAVSRAVARTVELAEIADQAGLQSFWVSEDPDGWDASAVLGAIAGRTATIRLGTGVFNPYYRHPALIAASVASLDLLSGGRAFLGLGRGQVEWYERALGLTVGDPVSRLRETIGLLRQWWSPASRASSPDDATEFAVTSWERSFRPVQPHPPIFIAAVGPKALRLAAELADGVIFNNLASLTFMEQAVVTIREHAAAVGRNLAGFAVICRAGLTVTDDPEAEYERRKATIALIHALPHMERLLVSPRYDTDRIIAEVRRVMKTEAILERGGGFADLRAGGDLDAAKRAIPTDLMAELVSAGSLPAMRQRIARFAALGVTDVMLAIPPNPAALHALVPALGGAA